MRIDVALIVVTVLCFELISIAVSIFRENKGIMTSRVGKAKVIRCEICSYVYFVSSHTIYSRCPVCLSINKRGG